ncbi:NERD domain-containing protein [Clostridium algidicarnis]|uniref:NERD domain-containing protein n=1 Tax=Clostridium algidicarnis TaxID=37659 RepID=UPI000494DE1A|nr:NERD domain-containing protein [Clostridium algidicarnis]
MNKEEICSFLIENNNEAIRLYKEYLNEWIDNNFMYFQSDISMIHMPINPDRSCNPDYILRKYIIELKLNNKKYFDQKDKNMFFIELSEKVLNDIKSYLLKFNKNLVNIILLFCYSISSYNRELGFNIVSFQQNGECIDVENQILNLLCTIMTKNMIFDTDTEWYTTKIEQFIATEDEALELLIKIISSEEYASKKSMNFTDAILKELLTLSHVLVLIIHTRQDLTKGINKMSIMEIDSEGIINAHEAFDWGNTEVSNYDYRFDMDWSEYSEQLTDELDNEIFCKHGFYLHDVAILEKMLILDKEITIGDKNKYLEMITDIGIEEKRAEKLFDYFSFNRNKEKIVTEKLYKYLITEYYDMSFQKIFINFDDTYFICYKFLAKYALKYFIASVFNSPNKFIEHEIVANKITDSFCKSVEKVLKNAYPQCKTITNYYCSNDREIDVVLILQNKIYLIECKRLAFAETSNNIQNMYKSLTKDYINQLDKELEAFEKNMDKILSSFMKDKLIDSELIGKYELKGLIVTKEFSPAHIQQLKYPILIKDKLIEYINNDIKKHKDF